MKTQGKGDFPAYDAEGNEYRYKTAIDQHHACTIAGYTMYRPGDDAPPSADPRRQYDAWSSEDLRKLCSQRGVKGYPLLPRDKQIAALEELDRQERETLEAATRKAPAKKSAAKGKTEGGTDEGGDEEAAKADREKKDRANKKAKERRAKVTAEKKAAKAAEKKAAAGAE